MSSTQQPLQQPTDWRVDYKLSERVEYTKFQNSTSIELQTQTDTQGNWLVGFTILLKGVTEAEVLAEAEVQAKRLGNILSVKRGTYVSCHQSGFTKKTANGWTTTVSIKSSYSIHTHIQIDLTDPKIMSLITADSDTNQQFHHYNLALRAESLGQYESMLTELFQVIEKDNTLQGWTKYKALRNALSHQKPVPKARVQVETFFGTDCFDFTANDEFEHNSPKNLKNLETEAKSLKSIVMPYVINKI